MNANTPQPVDTATQIQATRKEIEAIWYLLRGNGTAGFLERVRTTEQGLEQLSTDMSTLHTALNNLSTSLDELNKQRYEQAAEWRGVKKAVYILGALITLVSGGGYAWVANSLARIVSSP